MENNGFEKYSDIWKQADNVASQKKYSEKDISKIKMKNSKDFSRSINNSIVFDCILKGILILGMLLLVWLYKTDIPMRITLIMLIGLSSISVFKEFTMQKQLKKIDDYTRDLQEVISKKMDFYTTKFGWLKLMLAFTNALFVWVGSSFYYYSNYGYYKIEDFRDLMVAVFLVTIAFGISYLALSWKMKDNAIELEESLHALDDQVAAHLQDQLNRKRCHKMIMAIIAAIGLIIFIILVTTYLIQLY